MILRVILRGNLRALGLAICEAVVVAPNVHHLLADALAPARAVRARATVLLQEVGAVARAVQLISRHALNEAGGALAHPENRIRCVLLEDLLVGVHEEKVVSACVRHRLQGVDENVRGVVVKADLEQRNRDEHEQHAQHQVAARLLRHLAPNLALPLRQLVWRSKLDAPEVDVGGEAYEAHEAEQTRGARRKVRGTPNALGRQDPHLRHHVRDHGQD
mmetsp:Transcript_13348/g.25608  ORF Transcript_13348/g.25608 Transcript_13348/m.25608 type:complete len:217 (+) Transcript_13348:1778-2428(+)